MDYIGYLRPEDGELLQRICAAFDVGNYADALALTRSQLTRAFNLDNSEDVWLRGALAGWLIDIGSESGNTKPVRDGLRILKRDRDKILVHVHISSYEYNLGNAWHAIFKIQSRKSTSPIRLGSISVLLRAKQHYWRAYRNVSEEGEGLRDSLLVNLGNLFIQCGRIVEAIQSYDAVLREEPKHPEANLSRGWSLLCLQRMSWTYTANLLYQAQRNYAAAVENPRSTAMKRLGERHRDRLLHQLQALGYDEVRASHDASESEAEASQHSSYRQFCIEKHLTLAEHSLYCNCAGARRDDLAIPLASQPIGGNFVPRMELYLNRVKGEFTLARLLFYQAAVLERPEWKLYEREVRFTELGEGEYVGPRAELLRASFKLCFGILDRIARAVCELFSAAEPQEPLYFESFWNPRRAGLSPLQQARWDILNAVDNASLVALYALATDLNVTVGDWPEFKKWRNALEHGLLVIRADATEAADPHDAIDEATDYIITKEEFTARTLQLLQFTRASIIYFAMCVRTEGLKLSGRGTPIRLDGKEPSA